MNYLEKQKINKKLNDMQTRIYKLERTLSIIINKIPGSSIENTDSIWDRMFEFERQEIEGKK